MKAASIALLGSLVILAACSTTPEVATSSPSGQFAGPSAQGTSPAAATNPAQTSSLTPNPTPSQIPLESPSPPPPGTPVSRQVLAPAKVMPVVSLCSHPIQVYQDGNAGPLFCSNGLNVEAWKFFMPLGPHMLSLGPDATAKDVLTAFCADKDVPAHATNPEEISAYQLAAAYYGWSSNTNPEPGVITQGCG